MLHFLKDILQYHYSSSCYQQKGTVSEYIIEKTGTICELLLYAYIFHCKTLAMKPFVSEFFFLLLHSLIQY